eukprot:scaffold198708_cov31-Prasinocladus_malaysianus.AAC.1
MIADVGAHTQRPFDVLSIQPGLGPISDYNGVVERLQSATSCSRAYTYPVAVRHTYTRSSLVPVALSRGKFACCQPGSCDELDRGPVASWPIPIHAF